MMMKYGQDPVEHRFTLALREIEPRGQWLDVYLRLEAATGTALPAELEDPGVLVICSRQGTPVQIDLQEGGCDSEFQLTLSEKDQIERFTLEAPLVRQAIAQIALPE